MSDRIAPECGCSTTKIIRGMCQKHYAQWRHRTPPSERGAPPRFSRRFEDFVDKSGECWIWTGATNGGGYGYWSNGKDRGLAHRISLRSVLEPDDPSLFACHHCDNPPCVRPDHLYWGTAADNARDVVERHGVWNKGLRVTECPRGHKLEGENLRVVGRFHRCRECDNERSREFQRKARAARPPKIRVPASGERHGMSKLTWAVVRTARTLYAEGRSAASLAREYGISETHMYRVLANEAWREESNGAA